MKKTLAFIVPLILVAAVTLPRLLNIHHQIMLPAPTEHILREDAEQKNKHLRKEWFREMHNAPPDTDWKAIERANGLALQEMRNVASKSRVEAWTEIGSRNLAGRMHCSALSASGDSLYGGSSLGGVWKASLIGEGWRPLSDNLYGGCHGVAVATGPPETITAVSDGGLIHYSIDGGQTWIVPEGIGDPPHSSCKRVLRDMGIGNRVYLMCALTSGSRKLYRSDDGGMTYTRIARLGPLQGDIWIDRVNGGDIYFLRGNQTLRSSDAGASWDTLGTLPTSASNVILTGSEDGAPTLYAAANNGGWKLYRSTDGGYNWSYRHDIDDFWETLAASIVDQDIVVFAGVEMWRSTDGGGSFTKVNSWGEYYSDMVNKLHADHPGTDVHWVDGSESFYIATDGGLYRSNDGVATVTNISLEYLGISQYYDVHTSINDPYLILAGSQDQGYQRTTGAGVGSLLDFDQLISGDYGHLTSSDGTHEWVYSVYPGFILVQHGESSPVFDAYLDFPAGETHSVWMPFVLADPNEQKAFYFCASHLYRYYKYAGWQTELACAQDFTVNGGSYLSSLGISPVNTDRRIGVTNTGQIWYSTNGGDDWTFSPDQGPSASYLYGTSVICSPDSELVAYIGGSGYGGSSVYGTTDGGVSWTAVGDGLPSTLVYMLTFEGTGSGKVYAATEAGPYRMDPATDTWEYIGGAMAPLTTYWSCEAVPAAGVIRFGTYGRGIWDFDCSVSTDVAEAGDGVPSPVRGITSYPNPFNPHTTIAYHLQSAGDVSLTIYNTAGRVVRDLVRERLNEGSHETVWNGMDNRGLSCASGVYMARLVTQDKVFTKRMTLIR